jgi:hypothetical protein
VPDAGDGLAGGPVGTGPPAAGQELAGGHAGQLHVCGPGLLPGAGIGLHVLLVTYLRTGRGCTNEEGPGHAVIKLV